MKEAIVNSDKIRNLFRWKAPSPRPNLDESKGKGETADLGLMKLRQIEERHLTIASNQAAFFNLAGVDAPQARIAASDEVKSEFEVHLVRERGGISYLYSEKYSRAAKSGHNHGATYLYWFSKSDPSITRISCDVSDGQWAGLAHFCFSTCFNGKVLVPDVHFLRDRGYKHAGQISLQAPAWDDRGDTIYWRGHNNNVGLFSVDRAHIDQPWVMQRMRLAMKAREIVGLDARFVSGPQQRQEEQCAVAGLMGPRRPWAEWANDKYAIDIDGFTNAWSNLMQRLKLGCCVLKVESQHGFRQWYYDKLVPFETYVPVKADMSDLEQQIDWVRSHPREARAIAANGQAFARDMTLETETRAAARIIEENWL